jgi:hypothetical protein
MAEIDLSVSWARWNSLLQKPFFSGPPQCDYARHQLGLEIIFVVLFPQWTHNTARTEIYPRVKTSSSVLCEWRTQWQRDPTWPPWAKEIHGKHQHVFTDEEEAELVIEILDSYILPGRPFIDATFRELVLAAYASTGGDPGSFKCSQHFIDDFKRRYGFSSRRFHLRQRKQDPVRGDIAQWIEQITALLLEVPLERIVNCDETMWHVVPSGLFT